MTRVFLAPCRQPDMQLPHSVQPVRRGPGAAEVRVRRRVTPGCAEEDADRGHAEGVADAQVLGRAPHEVLDEAIAGLGVDAEHPLGRVVVRRELGLASR